MSNQYLSLNAGQPTTPEQRAAAQGNIGIKDTYANIVANFPAASLPEGTKATMTDFAAYGCLVEVITSGGRWVGAYDAAISRIMQKQLLIGGSGATWSRDGAGLITVNWTAHGLPTTEFNGASVHMTQGTVSSGTNITTGWGFTNFSYVDADNFTVQSTVLSAGNGALGGNALETFAPDIVAVPDDLFYPYSLSSVNDFRAKPSANTKTVKTYMGSFFQISTNITNAAGATAWLSQSGTRVIYYSNTQLMCPATISGNTGFVTTYSGGRNPNYSMQVPAAEWCCAWPERSVMVSLGG